MSETRSGPFRTILQIVCQLLWLSGLVVSLSGIYLVRIYTSSGVFFSNFYIILPAVLAIAGSAFLLCGGGLGCWVSVKDSTCLQAVFVYLLVIVFCLIGTAAALAYNSTDKVDSDLAPFREVFENYTGNRENPDSNAVDAIQEELQCCGINDYRDWLNTTWFNKTGNHEVPHSCCNTSVHNCNGTVNLPSLLYSKGCRVKLREAVIFVLRLMIISSFAVLLFLVCALFSVAQLMRDQHLVEYQILS
ncbi:tetraspanin 37 [Chanos chanos]|uniref:Tetraspanin n=1 Tax=Chanos chanos TaxID=29144 RepID=A0A6J2VKB5_CHACN|nr:tetraspanin-3-like [Chanos chanos]